MSAGLGRRSLLPSIPETLLGFADASDAAAKRAALLSAIAPEVLNSSPAPKPLGSPLGMCCPSPILL